MDDPDKQWHIGGQISVACSHSASFPAIPKLLEMKPLGLLRVDQVFTVLIFCVKGCHTISLQIKGRKSLWFVRCIQIPLNGNYFKIPIYLNIDHMAHRQSNPSVGYAQIKLLFEDKLW